MAGPSVDALLVELSRSLLPDSDELALGMVERVRAEIPVYRDAKVVSEADLVASCRNNLRYVLGNLAGERVDSAAPRETGAERALQGVPYPAVLQAFRVGGRYIWELLVEHAEVDTRESLLLAAADIWAVTDDLSEQVTDAYQTTIAEHARRAGQMRSALLGTVLDGGSTTQRQWEVAELLTLPRDGEFVVVAAECPAPGEEALPGVESLLVRRNGVSAWRVDHDHEEGLIGLRMGYGVARLAEDLANAARGRVGISRTFTSVEQASAARREARLACAAATPASRELIRFEEAPLAVLLAGTPDGAAAFVRTILGPVLDLPDEARQGLLQTARTWLAQGGSTSAAAGQLFLHRNTVRYRMRKLQELTGRNLSHPLEAGEVSVALECARILGMG